MRQTNLIGGAIKLVDQFAHLDVEDLRTIKEDSSEWYEKVKRPMIGENGKILDTVKPKGFNQHFAYWSEKWLVRIVVGLLFTLFVLPWARARNQRDRTSNERVLDRDRSRRSESSQYDRDGFDRDGFDRDGFDKEGFDEDGFDEQGYDRDGNHEEDDQE